MSLFDLPLQTLLSYLQKLAEQSLSLWDVPEDARVRLINVSENTTYLVEASQGYQAILRIHRENYHTLRAIESELAWLETLGREKVIKTPGYFPGRNGRAIQLGNTDGLNNARFRCCFTSSMATPQTKVWIWCMAFRNWEPAPRAAMTTRSVG